jgi:hypothetical protein
MTDKKECEHDFKGKKMTIREPCCSKCGTGMVDAKLDNAFKAGIAKGREEADTILADEAFEEGKIIGRQLERKEQFGKLIPCEQHKINYVPYDCDDCAAELNYMIKQARLEERQKISLLLEANDIILKEGIDGSLVINIDKLILDERQKGKKEIEEMFKQLAELIDAWRIDNVRLENKLRSLRQEIGKMPKVWKCVKCNCYLDETSYRIWESGDGALLEGINNCLDESFHCDCGCYEEDEDTGEMNCNCKFELAALFEGTEE